MGRIQARKTLDFHAEISAMNKKGIVHAIRNLSDLDEAPGAYKDIDRVMENQKDLAETVVELTPLAVIKG